MFGLEFLPNVEIKKIVELSNYAEEQGFETIWITDHYNNRNVYATLALLAQGTSTIKIGTGVTNPYHINPSVTASAIATINEISQGRAILGVGAGDKITMERLGIEWKRPLGHVKETVEICRKLFGNKRIDYDGEIFKIKGAKIDFPAGDIPIYVGAQGEKMLALSATFGDGVLINGSHPKDFEFAVGKLKSVLGDRKDFEIAAYACFSIDEDSDKAKNEARIVVAFIVAGSPVPILERHGISKEDADKVREAMNNAFTKGDWGGLAMTVTDTMMERFSVSGSPDECIARVEDLMKTGVTQVVVGSPIGPDKKKSIKLIGEELIAPLKG